MPVHPRRLPLAGTRIGFLLQGAPREHPVWSDVARRLAARGADVQVRFPAAELTDLEAVRSEHDLYVLKDTSPLGLSLAGALEAAGAAVVNPHAVATLCRDKILTTQALAAAGVPLPGTWVTQDPELLRDLAAGGPIVVKPHLGSRGIGVQVVRAPHELEGLDLTGGPVFVQRFHAPDGRGLDHKLYCIDGELSGVRRVWPSRTLADKLGQPFDPGDELRDIARRCARAIGADTFGFDVVISGGEPYVVDLSGFPGFKGVPGGTGKLASALEAAARRVAQGGPVVAGSAR
jgi:glutathione synthase/RimK-type ligase-like ATP-grasp enzyme